MKYLALKESEDGLIHLVFDEGGGYVQPVGDIIYPVASWKLGASTVDPSVGDGKIICWYTEKPYSNGIRVDLGLYIHGKGNRGEGTGGYEIYLPDHLEPDIDIYVGHFNLWISGGGVSEFDGSIKWTMRNEEKGPKLIFTTGGKEWSPYWPKRLEEFKLRGRIEYFI